MDLHEYKNYDEGVRKNRVFGIVNIPENAVL